MFHVEQDPHDVTYRRDVPELGVNTRLGGRLGQDGLEFFLLGAGEFRRVLVPGMPCQHRAHPGGLPLGQPFQHCPLRALNHFRNDADIDSFRGIQDSFCFHPNQHMIVGTLLPSDQDGGFFRGDPDLHVPIMSETAQEIHEKYDFVSCQPYHLSDDADTDSFGGVQDRFCFHPHQHRYAMKVRFVSRQPKIVEAPTLA